MAHGQRQCRAQGAVGARLRDVGRAGHPADTGTQSWEPPVPPFGNIQPALPSFCSQCQFSPSFSATPAPLRCTFCSCLSPLLSAPHRRHPSYLWWGEQTPPLLTQGHRDSSAAPASPQRPAEAGHLCSAGSEGHCLPAPAPLLWEAERRRSPAVGTNPPFQAPDLTWEDVQRTPEPPRCRAQSGTDVFRRVQFSESKRQRWHQLLRGTSGRRESSSPPGAFRKAMPRSRAG